MLCGYKRYSLAFDMWKRIAWLPRPLRKVLAMSLNGIANISPDKFDEVLKPVFERYGRAGRTSDKLKKAASLLQPVDRESFYRSLVSSWKDPAEVVVGLRDDPDSLLGAPPPWMLDLGFRDYMMYADAATYLPDDILVKVDRASMACGLEARVPVLDHRVVEFCMRLPVEHKLHNGKTKAPLRDLLAKYVPADLIERPKMGFGVPIGSWLRGPLKEWASDLLSHDRIQSDGYLRYEPIARKWAEHLNSERDWSGDIWSVLMFQAWLDARG